MRSGTNQGVLSRAGRGEGVICPKCGQFAGRSPGGDSVCPSGHKVVKGPMVTSPPRYMKRAPAAPKNVPSRHLGRNEPAALVVPEAAPAATTDVASLRAENIRVDVATGIQDDDQVMDDTDPEQLDLAPVEAPKKTDKKSKK